ncbi:MAG: class I SAM-dependent methyltransferase [Deltaproteobacteria bacterium]|uniref:Class I SAM-dependent methyltransferase n=1 Tax=Candidatus Zymogenus saltonus TaxID=2844893 RepID=A0A9D8KIT3_9DELT|nr:class I SAM-dependent methyltransferase [Candidatus Zymogenus saltonus]
MFKRIEHKEEAISGFENVDRYRKVHRGSKDMQYSSLIKGIKALNISGRYLEVGAGPGTLAAMIAQEMPNVQITAFDLSPEMAKFANEYISESGLDGRVRSLACNAVDKKEIEKLGTFDLVYSSFSLHHWRDPEKVIENLMGAVKGNGVLYLYDLKRVWWLYLVPSNGGFISSIRASYLPEEMGDLLDRLGMKKYETITHFPYFMQSIIVRK